MGNMNWLDRYEILNYKQSARSFGFCALVGEGSSGETGHITQEFHDGIHLQQSRLFSKSIYHKPSPTAVSFYDFYSGSLDASVRIRSISFVTFK